VGKKNPDIASAIQTTLDLLSEDAFQPRLKTHKFKRTLDWACSAGYDLRIAFEFVQYVVSKAILLETVVTHKEVY